MMFDSFEAILSGDPDELDVHLNILERDVVIEGAKVKVHCHCLTVDANGRVRIARLAEFMRAALIDYAVPKSKVESARQRDAKYRSGAAMSQLHYVAKETFTDLDNSGEGGELLLFLLAERFLKIPQVLCKMDLKTDARMHYHGADGVYGAVDENGILNLYWGESKLYDDPASAIRECLRSLRPFLLEPEGESAGRERDMILLSDKADLSDPKLTEGFKRFFDRSSPLSTRVRYGGIALVGFDSAIYPDEAVEAIADDIAKAARDGLQRWLGNIGNRIREEKLERFSIEFFCLPLPSAENLRTEFKKALGL